jgi:hypothetical protein
VVLALGVLQVCSQGVASQQQQQQQLLLQLRQVGLAPLYSISSRRSRRPRRQLLAALLVFWHCHSPRHLQHPALGLVRWAGLSRLCNHPLDRAWQQAWSPALRLMPQQRCPLLMRLLWLETRAGPRQLVGVPCHSPVQHSWGRKEEGRQMRMVPAAAAAVVMVMVMVVIHCLTSRHHHPQQQHTKQQQMLRPHQQPPWRNAEAANSAQQQPPSPAMRRLNHQHQTRRRQQQAAGSKQRWEPQQDQPRHWASAATPCSVKTAPRLAVRRSCPLHQQWKEPWATARLLGCRVQEQCQP